MVFVAGGDERVPRGGAEFTRLPRGVEGRAEEGGVGLQPGLSVQFDLVRREAHARLSPLFPRYSRRRSKPIMFPVKTFAFWHPGPPRRLRLACAGDGTNPAAPLRYAAAQY